MRIKKDYRNEYVPRLLTQWKSKVMEGFIEIEETLLPSEKHISHQLAFSEITCSKRHKYQHTSYPAGTYYS
ncbi:hypothetical protein DEU51_11470 [Pseudomonas jessenii]|uniref:Uncharacterized protein n=1 Tax=Pseudomonas jessenii TaxID=77298 RepID=A0A370S8Z0_PSEJE|nr:hypothetical protein DEU51_11470 [Pseudomonas jessenii]